LQPGLKDGGGREGAVQECIPFQLSVHERSVALELTRHTSTQATFETRNSKRRQVVASSQGSSQPAKPESGAARHLMKTSDATNTPLPVASVSCAGVFSQKTVSKLHQGNYETTLHGMTRCMRQATQTSGYRLLSPELHGHPSTNRYDVCDRVHPEHHLLDVSTGRKRCTDPHEDPQGNRGRFMDGGCSASVGSVVSQPLVSDVWELGHHRWL